MSDTDRTDRQAVALADQLRRQVARLAELSDTADELEDRLHACVAAASDDPYTDDPDPLFRASLPLGLPEPTRRQWQLVQTLRELRQLLDKEAFEHAGEELVMGAPDAWQHVHQSDFVVYEE